MKEFLKEEADVRTVLNIKRGNVVQPQMNSDLNQEKLEGLPEGFKNISVEEPYSEGSPKINNSYKTRLKSKSLIQSYISEVPDIK